MLDPDEQVEIEVLGHRAGDVVDRRPEREASLAEGDTWSSASVGVGRPLRAVRRAPLPPDPEDQVRAVRSLMLHELHIESMGVIDALDLVLTPGLTAFTGETGAGKTMLVEAINLLVGGRADPSIVRPGAAEARVEGRFVVGDDEYIVSRVIPADGRSRAYVNGRLATAATLAELGARTRRPPRSARPSEPAVDGRAARCARPLLREPISNRCARLGRG